MNRKYFNPPMPFIKLWKKWRIKNMIEIEQNKLDIEQNKEHCKILLSGKTNWNYWRKRNPGIRPNLKDLKRRSYTDFRGYDLSESDLHNGIFENCHFTDVNLSGSVLVGSIFSECRLSGADLSNTDSSFIELIKTTSYRVNFTGANLHNAIIEKCEMDGSEFKSANLTSAKITHCKMPRSNLSEADLTDASIRKTNFYKANLTKANLKNAICRGSNLEKAVLCASKLINTDFSCSDFSFTDFTNASFLGVNLTGIDNIEWAKLNNTDLKFTTIGSCSIAYDSSVDVLWLVDRPSSSFCTTLKEKDWRSSSDAEIAYKGAGLLAWWYENKQKILDFCRKTNNE